MTDKQNSGDRSEFRKGGAAGPRVNVRKGIQTAVLVFVLFLVFVVPVEVDRRALLFGAMVLVVTVDLAMLLRGDLTYTHFESRDWSFRVNAVLLAIALILFSLTLLNIL